MTGDPLTVGIGIALLTIGADWRSRVVRRRRTALRARLQAALAHPDPAMRRAAARVAVQQGLATSGQLLLDAIRSECDETVLDAYAQEVARNQWEPCSDGPVLELRLWSAHRLEQAEPPAEQSAKLVAVEGGQTR